MKMRHHRSAAKDRSSPPLNFTGFPGEIGHLSLVSPDVIIYPPEPLLCSQTSLQENVFGLSWLRLPWQPCRAIAQA
jgi:hypothetical protein